MLARAEKAYQSHSDPRSVDCVTPDSGARAAARTGRNCGTTHLRTHDPT